MAKTHTTPGKFSNEVLLASLDGTMRQDLMFLAVACHQLSVNAGWYQDPKTGEMIDRNIPEMLCLIHSEISEALEGLRKNKMDDHIPHRSSLEVELADAVIREFELAGLLQLDLAGAIIDKLVYNTRRKDHRLEERAKADGKQF